MDAGRVGCIRHDVEIVLDTALDTAMKIIFSRATDSYCTYAE